MITLALLAILVGSGTDVVIPVAGNWRGTGSTLRLINRAAGPAAVHVDFIPSSAEPSSLQIDVTLAPSESRAIDIGETLLHGTQAVGAVRVRSSGRVNAEVTLRPSGTFAAVPRGSAIGTGESTTISVPALGSAAFRLFVAETRGFPLYFSATVGNASRRYYVAGGRQSTNIIDTDLGIDRSQPFTLELHGVNGSGRIIAAGAAVAADKTITPYAMTERNGWRHRMPAAEIFGYVLVFITICALKRRC